MPDIHTYEAIDKLAESAADLVLESARESVRLRGRFVWLLSGGTTPRMLYRLLAEERYSARMPWQKTYVFWGDERWVPQGDPESNAGAAEEDLLSRVLIPASQVHPIITEGVQPRAAAAAAERQIRALFADADPRPDLVLLGLGEEGHTASLFPGGSVLAERNLLFTAEYVSKLGQWRVTATLRLINAARHVVFLVQGTAKANAVRQVLAPQPESIALPASLVHPTQGKLTWLLDKEAAQYVGQLG